MEEGRRNWPEIAAAVAVCLFGLFMAVKGADLPIGSLQRMGAGFMPVALGTILSLLGLVLIFEALRTAPEALAFRLRPLLVIAAAVLFFAFTVRSLGLIPATILTIVISAAADSPFRPLRALLAGAIISGLGYLIFLRGLRLSLDPFWW